MFNFYSGFVYWTEKNQIIGDVVAGDESDWDNLKKNLFKLYLFTLRKNSQ